MLFRYGIIYMSITVLLNFAVSTKTNGTETDDGNIVWIDMEMTDLSVPTGHIMEIAVIVTDSFLNIIAEGPDIVVHQPVEILANMCKWCKYHHGLSGLIDASYRSNVSVAQAEQQVLHFISKYVKKSESPLAGSTTYMDRMFLQHYMPTLEKYLSDVTIDVSTVTELMKRWKPSIVSGLYHTKFSHVHRAILDIKNSIMDLEHYRRYICRELYT